TELVLNIGVSNEFGHSGVASVPDTRVEHDVEQVHKQIEQHVDSREKQQHALNHGIVARKDGIDDQSPNTGNGEHAFRHRHATEQQGDADADDGNDRNRAVGEGVMDE